MLYFPLPAALERVDAQTVVSPWWRHEYMVWTTRQEAREVTGTPLGPVCFTPKRRGRKQTNLHSCFAQ